ncbi:MAG TPA: penicillin-binding protein 1A [Patescibacteria group bacterium]|nr:penicillin-binding protein 1A [Patescibacteria group bacterium]
MKETKDKEPQAQPATAGMRRGIKKMLQIALMALFIVVVASFGAAVLLVKPVIDSTPELKGEFRPAVSTQIFDAAGNLLITVHATENRLPVPIDKIPLNLQNAFIAAEDARFHQHFGVDVKAIGRAIWANLAEGGVAEGGSTITQQLAKNAALTQERTWKRKIQEALLALELERRYSKAQIMEMYLNQIYFGEGAYGVQTAAQVYFGKNANELNLAECAMLAGLPKRPNDYSPFASLKAAKERQITVLGQMVRYGLIDQAAADQALRAEIRLAPRKKEAEKAPYFVDYVLQTLIRTYGADMVYKEGLKVYTTLDMEMQTAAEKAMNDYLPTYFTDETGMKQPQGALVALDPGTGQIRAMIGGRGGDKFNRAVLAERQPGSAFKPFVYLAALTAGVSPEAVVEDRPTSFGSYAPRNYDHRFRGLVTIRSALEQSLNVIAVRLANHVGPEKVVQLAQQMGITTLVNEGPVNDHTLAMALGGLTRGVTPLEMVSAYGVLANDGVRVEPTGIEQIVDRKGTVIYQRSNDGKPVVDRDLAHALTDMMQGVVSRGTGAGADIGRPVAGKTGTTNDYQDAWFVGFTPNMAAAVWLGCDNNESLDGVTGGDLPATIWRQFMIRAVAKLPVEYFPPAPVGIFRGIAIKDGAATADLKADAARAEGYFDNAGPEQTAKTGNDGKGKTVDDRTSLPGSSGGSDALPMLNSKDRPIDKPVNLPGPGGTAPAAGK